jgi:hypothetical protein
MACWLLGKVENHSPQQRQARRPGGYYRGGGSFAATLVALGAAGKSDSEKGKDNVSCVFFYRPVAGTRTRQQRFFLKFYPTSYLQFKVFFPKQNKKLLLLSCMQLMVC